MDPDDALIIPTRPIELLPIPFQEMLACLQIDLRKNVRSDRREWRFVNPETMQWTTWQDSSRDLESFIRAQIKAKGVLFTDGTKDDGSPRLAALSKERFEEVTQAISHIRQVDPLLEWLDQLDEWDLIERIGNVLETVFGVAEDTDTAYAQWCSMFPFVGAIERAKTPGSSIQEVVVLVSSQGTGKSTLLHHLLPPELELTGELSFALDEGRRVEATLGRAIIEITEMGGSTAGKTSIEEIKSFVSRTHDTWRLAYRPEPQSFKRRFVMVGTTNRTDSLPADASGNRRFAPIDLVGAKFEYEDLLNWLNENRDQLWAEALFAYNDGVRAALPKELKEVAALQTEGHRYVYSDSIEDAIALLPPGQMSFSRIKDLLSPNLTDGELKRDSALSKALRTAGWTRAKSGRPRLWSSPPSWGSEQFVSDDDYEQAERQGLAE